MRFANVVKPVAAASLIVSSSFASAAPMATRTTAKSSACGSAMAAGAAVTAQVARPGCVLPAINAGVPVSTEVMSVPAQPFIGGLLLPTFGLAALVGLLVALNSGSSNSLGSLSRG